VVVCPAGQRVDGRCSLELPTEGQRAELRGVAGVDAVARAAAVVGRVALAVVLAILAPLFLAIVPTVRESRRQLGAVLRVE